ncbi:MAG TPA: FAD-dependent oxidoreductase [Candidatus Sulfotelmatobacter sp.]|nr:FAD-dependent oxidoreductase [Candidatus Sulfotelmatobacter sp.]
MPIVVKKVRRLGAGGGGAAAGGEKGTSSLRPEFAEKTPGCAKACPNHHDVRAAVMTIAQAEARGKSLDAAFEEAFYILADKNPLPASVSRACPHQCEDQCLRTQLDAPVSINALERFIGDFALEKRLPLKRATDERHSEQIAVIGSGPGALSCAYQLTRRGYPVTMLEAFPEPGGMLRYGIPPHRAPRHILEAEIDRLRGLGVEIQCNVAVGKDVSYEDLRARYAAIFVGIRAGWDARLDLPGADAPNVLSAIEFLHRVNAGEAFAIGGSAVVIGGSDTALDAARVAVRLGARTTVVFRKTLQEMPAGRREVEEAQREGVQIECQATPSAIVVEAGRAAGLRCGRSAGEAEAAGEFVVAADTIIAATKPERDTAGLAALCDADGRIAANEVGETGVANTFVGGDDLELGIGATAVFRGRRAAEVIHARFRGLPLPPAAAPPAIEKDRMRLDHYPKQSRADQTTVSVAERLAAPAQEVVLPISAEQAVAEAKRCLSCGLCFACDTCWKYCQEQAIVRPPEKGQAYRIKLEFCTGCKKCAEECPCGYIDMR